MPPIQQHQPDVLQVATVSVSPSLVNAIITMIYERGNLRASSQNNLPQRSQAD